MKLKFIQAIMLIGATLLFTACGGSSGNNDATQKTTLEVQLANKTLYVDSIPVCPPSRPFPGFDWTYNEETYLSMFFNSNLTELDFTTQSLESNNSITLTVNTVEHDSKLLIAPDVQRVDCNGNITSAEQLLPISLEVTESGTGYLRIKFTMDNNSTMEGLVYFSLDDLIASY